jgi:hypothetical protein
MSQRRLAHLLPTTASFAAIGCVQAAGVHPFYAARYDPSRHCLGPVEVLDVLPGSGTDDCGAATCWLNPRTGEAFVSTACQGPRDLERVGAPAAGSVCESALSAFARGGAGRCGANVGSADAGDGS